MSRCVARPDDEIDLILQVLGDPFEGVIDKRERRIAVGRLGAIGASRALSAMAGDAFFGGGMDLVKFIGMEI